MAAMQGPVRQAGQVDERTGKQGARRTRRRRP